MFALGASAKCNSRRTVFHERLPVSSKTLSRSLYHRRGSRPDIRRRILTQESLAQTSTKDRLFAEYRATVACLFPGQGAQKVGMAKVEILYDLFGSFFMQEVVENVPAARELFDRASDVLEYNLLKICLEGPEEILNSTRVCQPAIMVTSLAAVEKLRATQGQEAVDACDVTCGLSLGEYTALTFAGAFSFEDAVDVLRFIAGNSQRVADETGSLMVSVIGLDAKQVERLCLEASARAGEGEMVTIANYLCPGNLTVAGSPRACQILQDIAVPEFKAKLTIKLAVAGAFHTHILDPVADLLRQKLMDTPISTPRIPVLSNVDGRPHRDPDTIRETLLKHIVQPVQWEMSMREMLSRGLVKSYEMGPGKVLTGLFKRIDRSHPVEKIEI